MQRAVVLAVLLFVAFTNAIGQQTIHVPTDMPTIGQAVIAAADGDTVVVLPGTYFENVVVSGSVTLLGTGGAEATHIVGVTPGLPVVTLDGAGLLPGPRLEGFTVRGGDATGLAVIGPAITRKCTVRNNAGPVGGISVQATAPVLFDACRVRDNLGDDGADVDPTGACGADPRGGPGGILSSGNAGCFFVNCEVVSNSGGDGGDVLTPCVGAAGLPGAGAFRCEGAVTLVNCTVSRNVGGSEGDGGSLRIGAFDHVAAGPVVINSIVHSNTGRSFHFTGSVPSAPPTVAFSNVQGFVGGTANMDADPRFVDARAGDFRLSSNSPCIDTGDAALPGLPVVDFEDHPRVVGIGVEMGCDEFVPDLPDTGDDVELLTRINGFGGRLDAKIGFGGADLTAEIVANTGPYYGAVPILLAQAFSNGFIPTGIPQAFVYIDLDDFIVLHDGRFDPGPALGFAPVEWGPVRIPHGLDTVVLRLQAFALTPLAINGTYAATRARDVDFRF